MTRTIKTDQNLYASVYKKEWKKFYIDSIRRLYAGLPGGNSDFDTLRNTDPEFERLYLDTLEALQTFNTISRKVENYLWEKSGIKETR